MTNLVDIWYIAKVHVSIYGLCQKDVYAYLKESNEHQPACTYYLSLLRIRNRSLAQCNESIHESNLASALFRA